MDTLKIAYRGTLYPATVLRETAQRVKVSYNTPARFHVGDTYYTIPHIVWLRKDSPRLYSFLTPVEAEPEDGYRDFRNVPNQGVDTKASRA